MERSWIQIGRDISLAVMVILITMGLNGILAISKQVDDLVRDIAVQTVEMRNLNFLLKDGLDKMNRHRELDGHPAAAARLRVIERSIYKLENDRDYSKRRGED